jgi:hypothetical protein
MKDEEFDLWLEFEQFVEPAGTPQPYFNMVISFRDGRRYALNVWVDAAIPEILEEGRELGLNLEGGYSIGPDLIVRSHERAFLEAVVRDLVAEGELLPAWLVPPDGATSE